MSDTIEIEVLPFADVVVLLTDMSVPQLPVNAQTGQGLVESDSE